MKMSETFHNGSISAEFDKGNIVENGWPIFVGGCKYKAQAIAVAVNSHDKLTEQKKMLREALSLVVDKIPMNQNIYGGGYMLLLSYDDCRILRETLNISELD
jgi:ABC-type oligopeptide transport system substrate-binding subunit